MKQEENILQQETNRRPCDCCYQLTDNLWCGEYPGRKPHKDNYDRLASCLAFGITAFVDLTEEGELEDYQPMIESYKPMPDAMIAHHRFPVRDRSVPSIETIQRVIHCIDELLSQGKKVYLHCRGGVGRTNTMATCWWLTKHPSLTGHQALLHVYNCFKTNPKSSYRHFAKEGQFSFMMNLAVNLQSQASDHSPEISDFTFTSAPHPEQVCPLYGALGGDLIGSAYEGHSRQVHAMDFPLFKNGDRLTDDSILTIATAEQLLVPSSYGFYYRKWGQRYCNGGFSRTFKSWLLTPTQQPPYQAHSNGAAMRCSAIGFACDSIDGVLTEAAKSAAVSHDHPEGIKGAQAAALAVFLARTGKSKQEIKEELEQRFNYQFKSTIYEYRNQYLDYSCECTIRVALQAFFESDSYESAVRKAIFTGGDSDTFAAIAGSIALAFYKAMPEAVVMAIELHLTNEMRQVCDAFSQEYPLNATVIPSSSPIQLPLCRWRSHSWSNTFNDITDKANNSAPQEYHEILHNLRIGVFQNTVSIVKAGAYWSEDKFPVLLPDGTAMQQGTCFYATEQPQAVQKHLTEPTIVQVMNEDCLLAAKQLQKEGFHPAVLNMASSRNPGGGVFTGAGAQEENIFRRSNLFLSMYQFASYANDYGIQKQEQQYPLDANFGGVYSPDVCVFRGTEQEGYPLLDQKDIYTVSVISVPGLNRPELNSDNTIVSVLVPVIKHKMRTIFRMGLAHGHDALVLGALGCGAFQNPPDHIARLFQEVMREPEFLSCYKKIVFAILEDHNSMKSHNPEGNLRPFQFEFANHY